MGMIRKQLKEKEATNLKTKQMTKSLLYMRNLNDYLMDICKQSKKIEFQKQTPSTQNHKLSKFDNFFI